MKGIVVTIISFALAFVLIVGVIIPIVTKGKTTGQSAFTQQSTIDTSVTSLAVPVN